MGNIGSYSSAISMARSSSNNSIGGVAFAACKICKAKKVLGWEKWWVAFMLAIRINICTATVLPKKCPHNAMWFVKVAYNLPSLWRWGTCDKQNSLPSILRFEDESLMFKISLSI